jgi:hypothetical protein
MVSKRYSGRLKGGCLCTLCRVVRALAGAILLMVLRSSSLVQAISVPQSTLLGAPLVTLSWDGTEMVADGPETATFYPAMAEFYRINFFIALDVHNTTQAPLTVLRVEGAVELGDGTRCLYGVTVDEVVPSREASGAASDESAHALFGLNAETIDRPLLLNNRTASPARVTLDVEYAWGDQARHETFEFPATIQSLNAYDAACPEMLAAYVDPAQPEILAFVRQVLADHPEETGNWEQAALIFDALDLCNVRYQYDPTSRWATGQRHGLDTIFLPAETLAYRQGDCDDLAVLYATALESVGIPTRLIFRRGTPGHVWVAFAAYDVELPEDELRRMLHLGPGEYLSDCSFSPLEIPLLELYDRFGDQRLWIPVETTYLGPPRCSLLGLKGIGWVRNNFTAAVQAGRRLSQDPALIAGSYSLEEARALGILPAGLVAKAPPIPAAPEPSALTDLYRTEMWCPAWGHVLIFARRNWCWALPLLVLGGYLGFRVLNAIVGGMYEPAPSQPSRVDPNRALREMQMHEVLRTFAEHKVCPRCKAVLDKAAFHCPRCGLEFCPKCGGAVHPGTRQCQRCGATYDTECPRCGATLQAGQYTCSMCGARFCAKCGGLVDTQTMQCTRCGQQY